MRLRFLVSAVCVIAGSRPASAAGEALRPLDVPKFLDEVKPTPKPTPKTTSNTTPKPASEAAPAAAVPAEQALTDYPRVVEAMRTAGCAEALDKSTSPAVQVSDRVDAARRALACAEDARAALKSQASTAESRARIDELMAPAVNRQTKALDVASADDEFLGLKWGLAFGYSYAFDDVVDDAAIVNGVVRAKSSNRQQPRVLLEYHKYLSCNAGGTSGVRGCGPFVAVAASQDRILSGVAMGVMYGRRTSATDSDGFSIGLGVILDAKVKSLAQGFVDGSPPPAGETEIRFKTEARWSGVLFVSRTF